MMDDTDISVKNKVPQFDRTIKPLHKPQPSEIKAARQRNFSPVYGNVVRLFYIFEVRHPRCVSQNHKIK